MSNTPIISVIIVTYNRLNVLKNCLEALRVQTLAKEKYEVVIVDDGSTDGTKEYLRNLDWQEKPVVRVFFNEHNGYVVARNFGAREARGQIVSYTDDDCVPEPQWLEKVVATFKENQSVGVVGAVTVVAFKNRLFAPLNQAFRTKKPKPVTPEINLIEDNKTGFIGLKPFSGCNIHIKRDIFLNLDGFDESIGPAEDLDFMYRYLEKGGKAAHRPDLVVDHFERDDLRSMFKRWFTFGKCDAEMVRRYLRSSLSIEINVFHGILNYHFIKIPFPLNVYLHIDLLKFLGALTVLSIFLPTVGLTLFALFFGGLFLKQRNPKLTLSFLFYSIYSQFSYTLGMVSTIFRKKVIYI